MRNKGLSFYKKKKKISQELLREIFSWIFGIALSVFLAAVVVIFLGGSLPLMVFSTGSSGSEAPVTLIAWYT